MPHPLLWVLGCAMEPAATPSGLPAIATAAGTGVGLGQRLANVGDADGDGTDDIAVSGADGMVSLYLGSAERALEAIPVVPETADAALTDVHGGDFDGDGLGEVVVAVPFADEGRGLLSVFALPDLSRPKLVVTGAEAHQATGASVASGDINGDGLDDLMVGAMGFSGSMGDRPVEVSPWVGVWLGPLSEKPMLYRPEVASDRFAPARGIGDVNGDGLADITIETADGQGDDAQISSFHGSRSGLVPRGAIRGLPAPGDRLDGYRVVGVGDVTGDGCDDATLMPNEDTGADTWLLAGSTVGLPAAPTWRLDLPDRASVTPIGDVDGDGFDDVLVASPDDDDATGRVDIWLGSAAGLAPSDDRSLFGEDRGGRFGSAAAAGDFDGDGRRDLVVTAPGALGERGQISVYYGGQ